MLFCEINPVFYEISRKKEICKRHIKNFFDKSHIAKTHQEELLPNVLYSYSCNLIKTGPGIDIELQQNKAVNINLAGNKINKLLIRPNEVFSFWLTVGKPSKGNGYKAGRTLRNGVLVPGVGGGLCNLANTIHLLVLHSPLKVVEFHSHSDALAPDNGKRVPFSAGTSVNYNNLDYRFLNDTNTNFQLCTWCDDNKLYGELRCEKPLPWRYEIVEEGHHFHQEGEKFYRISKIYKMTYKISDNSLIEKQLVLDNHSKVMFDYSLIPKDLIR